MQVLNVSTKLLLYLNTAVQYDIFVTFFFPSQKQWAVAIHAIGLCITELNIPLKGVTITQPRFYDIRP